MPSEDKLVIKKIVFNRSGVHPDNVLAYKHILGKYGIGTVAVCETIDEKNGYDSSIEVFCFEEWLEEKWEEIKSDDLLECQWRYKLYNLWEIYYTDRYIRYKYTYNDACKIIVGAVFFWEYLFDINDVYCLVSDCIIGAHNFYGMIVGEKRGKPYISIQLGRYKKYYSFFSTKEGFRDIEYDDWIAQDSIVTEDEIKNAETYVLEYISNKSHPSYIFAKEASTKKVSSILRYYIRRVKNISYLWDSKFNNKFNTKLYKSKWNTLDSAKEAIRSNFIKQYFNNPDYNERYVLFPLHFQPEASTCVYARKYENQLFLIEQLSKSIPAGLLLYVKEHIVRQGHRPLSFYREIKKYPNVKLINPDSSGHELIQHSEFIVCLTSTMGFEALMYGKPVFVCGDCFFQDFSGAIRLYDVYDEKDKFFSPPCQDRNVYLKQMALYLKSLHICTTHEQPMKEETEEGLFQIRQKTMRELICFLESQQKCR